MKTLLVIAMSFFAVLAQAEEPISRTISVKSFAYTENGNFKDQSAELCGVVSGEVTAHDRVTVTADHKSEYAAPYTTLVDQEGKFCVLIRTITGRASAELWGVNHKKVGNAVIAEIGKER